MQEALVGQVADFDECDRLIVSVGDLEIGVFRCDDGFVAYENRCLHQSGPACEGILIGKVDAVLGPDRSVRGERFSESVTRLVCPWHGWEYDLRTGECPALGARLRRFEVVERDGGVSVVV